MTTAEAFELANELDAMITEEHEVTDWEADFLDSILKRKGATITAKQADVLRRMADKYRMKGWLQ